MNSKVIERLRNLAFPEKCSQIRSVHVLDLAKDGYIRPHVDSIRVSTYNICFHSMPY